MAFSRNRRLRGASFGAPPHASQSDAGLPGPGCWPLRDPLMMFQSFKSHAIVYHWHVSLSFCPYRLTLSHIHTCSRTHAHTRTHASAQKIKRVELIHKQTRWSGVDAVRGAIGMIASADGKKSNAVRKNKQKENMSVAVRRVGCSARCRAGRQKTIPSLSDDVSIEYSVELHSGTVGAWREIWSCHAPRRREALRGTYLRGRRWLFIFCMKIMVARFQLQARVSRARRRRRRTSRLINP